jgi:hypothetical protein
MVEIFVSRLDDEDLVVQDVRPKFRPWKTDTEAESRPCVYAQELTSEARIISLNPGTYTVVAHAWSECTFFRGGTIYRYIQVPPRGQAECYINPQYVIASSSP